MNILLAIGSAFISLYALVSIAAIIATGLSFLNRRGLFFTRKFELRYHQLIVLLIVPLSVIPFNFPTKTAFNPIVRVWAAQSLKSFGKLESNGNTASDAFFSVASSAPLSVDFLSSAAIGLGLLCLIFAVALIRVLRDMFLLRRLTMNSFSVRQVRRVRIVCSEQVQVPLSFRIPGLAVVCLPTDLLITSDTFRLSVFHELQHHRQHDTMFVYAFSALKNFCFLNPLIHLWCSVVNDVQEFACDEALIGRKNVSAQAYIGCLLEVAETVVQQRKILESAPSIALVAGRKKLKRRIENMRSLKKVCFGRVSMGAIGLASAFVLLGTARAAQGLIQDRRVTLKEAVALANEMNAKHLGT